MAGQIEARLAELGIELPQAAAPAANYVPYVVSGNLVFVSGQVTVWNGEFHYQGKVGQDLGVEDGQAAARLCALNIVAQVKAACGGDLDRVVRIVRLGGFVNSTPDGCRGRGGSGGRDRVRPVRRYATFLAAPWIE
jgi:enamine deaminase RidA (YjgF/YER057c/UK114 family)